MFLMTTLTLTLTLTTPNLTLTKVTTHKHSSKSRPREIGKFSNVHKNNGDNYNKKENSALVGFEPQTVELTFQHANHSTTEHLTIAVNNIGSYSACVAFFTAYFFIDSKVFASRIVRLFKLVVSYTFFKFSNSLKLKKQLFPDRNDLTRDWRPASFTNLRAAWRSASHFV